MQSLSYSIRWFSALILLCATACAGGRQDRGSDVAAAVAASHDTIVVRRPAGVPVPPFRFSRKDERFLDEIQHATFRFFWDAVSPRTGMVVDRTSVSTVSVAGVGFQLAAIPIGIERGWVTREQGLDRVLLILRSLMGNPTNRKAGLFYHYVNASDAGSNAAGYETVVSTIDSAILFAGAITAASYFGGEVRTIVDRMLDEANWAFFVPRDAAVSKPYERGFISLAWKPQEKSAPTGDGALLPYYWVDSGDEQRLVTFLAAAATREAHRVPAETYFRMRRTLGRDEGGEPFAWFPWSGALFTNFFAHLWIDYPAMEPDDPGRLGVHSRPSIDWWENSRRAVHMHRRKAIANPLGVPTLGENAWGLTAGDSPVGYLVPGLFPTRVDVPGWRAEFDFSTVQPKDNYGDGTIAPYGAGASIMFEPEWALEALRHYRGLRAADGAPLAWRDAASGGFGFRDSVNLGKMWVAPDYVAIDQGPLLIAIENARTGRVWRWFGAHPAVQNAEKRLGMQRLAPSP